MSLQPNPLAPPPAKRRGCFFYGCMTSIVVSVVLILGIWFGIRYVISNAVEQYTQATPVELPALDSTTESYLKVKGKVEAFQAAIRQNQPSSLELTGPEINTYLASHPGLEGITDNFRVSIDGSDLLGTVSVPLDQYGYADRFFNGTLSLTIEMKGGELKAGLKGLKVGSVEVSDAVLSQIGKENLLEQAEPDKREKIAEALAGVSTITVQNGVLRMSGGENQAR